MSNLSHSLQKAHEAQQKRIELGIKVVVLNPLEKAIANPKSLRLAINGKCFDCMGAGHDVGVREMIKNCWDDSCSLHSVRPYQQKESTK